MADIPLTGEQKKVLTLPVEHPVLIKGAAGSGKTTVAIYRARHLMQTQSDLFLPTRVGIFSYTNALVNYVRAIIGPTDCSINTLHSCAGSLLCHAGRRAEVEIDTYKLESHLRAALSSAREKAGEGRAILGKPTDFYLAEIAWIKGRRISDRTTYLSTARAGRGTTDRVTMQDKEILWTVFEGYNAGLSASGRIDWSDLILRALALTESPTFIPPYSHIVVDEAQDLTYAQLSLIARLVTPETDSITLVADSAQRIYQSGFSWSDTGLNVRGRTVEFRRNYRNTRQIAEAACSLLSKETDCADFTEVVLPEREGAAPTLTQALNPFSQAEIMVRTVRPLFAGGGTVAVASPTKSCVRSLLQIMSRSGLPTHVLGARRRHPPTSTVIVGTLHAIKGIEFDHVILCDLNDDLIPADPEVDDPEECSRSRKLLYVGMTRARETLTLLCSGTPSRLLADIDPQKIRIGV